MTEDYQNKTLFFLTGLPRTGTSWMRRMIDAHPEVVCKGEARLVSSPFTQGRSLWDDLQRAVSDWVMREGSRKGNGFCEPEHEEIAWRQGSPIVTSDFVRRETQGLTKLASASVIRYLLLNNIQNGEKATGEKTPVTKVPDLDRFGQLQDAGVPFVLISTQRKFSDWLKSYHKHHLFRWETTYETHDFFPFTRDDYIRSVRGVRDHDKAPGQIVTKEQIGQAYEMYRKVNRRLLDLSDIVIPYDLLKVDTENIIRQVFRLLDVEYVEEPARIAKELAALDSGNTEADASKHTLEEYFRDQDILDKLQDIDQMEGWINDR